MSTLRSVCSYLALAALLLAPAAWSQQVAPFELTTRIQDLGTIPAEGSGVFTAWWPQTLAVVGDLDGNGVPDLAVGYPDWLQGTGRVQVLLMDDSGQVLESRGYWPGYNGLPATTDKTRFGHAITALGDVDGDGLADLAVGAPDGDGPLSGSVDSGHVWVLLTRPGQPQVTARRIDGDNPAFNGQLPDLAQLGTAVAGLGDVDGDGLVDLAAGAPRTGAPFGLPEPHGEVWLLSLNTQGALSGPATSFAPPGLTGGPGGAARFGARLVAPGDLNGDGHPDLAASAENESFWVLGFPTQLISGTVHLMLLDGTGHVADHQRLSAISPVFQDAAQPPTALGQHLLAAAGDLDGDGGPDLVVDRWLLRSHADQTTAVSMPSLRQAARWHDLDGDGLEEWVGLDLDWNPVLLWHRLPGRWSQPSLATVEQQLLLPAQPQVHGDWALTAADDRDGDGATDLHTRYEHLAVQPGGVLGSSTPLSSSSGTGPSFTIGDVDGDDRLDTARLQQSWAPFFGGYMVSRELTLELTSLGAVTAWTSFQGVGSGSTAFSTDPWVVSIGDLDGNGVPDLLMRTIVGEAQLVRLDANGLAIDVAELTPPFPLGQTQPIPLGDVDGDGTVDLLCRPTLDLTWWPADDDTAAHAWVLHLDPQTGQVLGETDITPALLQALPGFRPHTSGWTAVPTPWGVRIASPLLGDDQVFVADLDGAWQAVGGSVLEAPGGGSHGVAWLDEPGGEGPLLAVGLEFQAPFGGGTQEEVWRLGLAQHPVRQVPTGQPAPMLSLHGSFAPLEPCAFRVYGAPANQPALLVAGLEHVGLPLHGGVLVPSPDVLIAGFETTAGGRLAHTWPWPDDVPSGLEVFWQVWVRDPDAPQGWLASQGAASITP